MTVELLRQLPLFSPLTDERASRACSLFLERRFPKNRVLFNQDEPSDYLYVIVRGRVRVSLLNVDGREIQLRTYGPREVVGELAVLDGGRRSAGAIAVDDVHAYLLGREHFLQLLREDFGMVEHVLKLLVERLRYTTAFTENLVFLDAPRRIAATLAQLADAEQPGANTARLEITQQGLANMTGTTREWVNKALGEFARLGLVRVERGAIVIPDVEKLRVHFV